MVNRFFIFIFLVDLVLYSNTIHPVSFFEEFFVGGRADEHELGEMAVGFVFEAGDFFSGTNRTADYRILCFWIKLYCRFLLLFATEEFHFCVLKVRAVPTPVGRAEVADVDSFARDADFLFKDLANLGGHLAAGS